MENRSNKSPQQLDIFAQAFAEIASKPKKKSKIVEPVSISKAVQELAHNLPPRLYMGTSSWSFPGWERLVYNHAYKQNHLANQGLQAYAQHPLFRSVGIDRSYYRPLTQTEFAIYAEVVPEDFRFLSKAHEACTVAVFPMHPRYGQQRGKQNPSFLDPEYAIRMVIEPMQAGLGQKAGPILFQFSPQDLDYVGGGRHLIQRLQKFLSALPQGPIYAVEVRNASLLTREYTEMLADLGICHCINVYPGMPPPFIQYQQAKAEQMPALVMRWMLHPGYSYEQAQARYAPFNQIVDEDRQSRRQLAQLCLQAKTNDQPTFLIVNNKAEGSSPLSIELLAKEILAQSSN